MCFTLNVLPEAVTVGKKTTGRITRNDTNVNKEPGMNKFPKKAPIGTYQYTTLARFQTNITISGVTDGGKGWDPPLAS